ncbi:hypothetical protein BC828DRAFT_388022 [Blastocladiella britannica]|nr:hypothetical protein BC828DRAFT_388022 [Blastocladiella britannica]
MLGQGSAAPPQANKDYMPATPIRSQLLVPGVTASARRADSPFASTYHKKASRASGGSLTASDDHHHHHLGAPDTLAMAVRDGICREPASAPPSASAQRELLSRRSSPSEQWTMTDHSAAGNHIQPLSRAGVSHTPSAAPQPSSRRSSSQSDSASSTSTGSVPLSPTANRSSSVALALARARRGTGSSSSHMSASLADLRSIPASVARLSAPSTNAGGHHSLGGDTTSERRSSASSTASYSSVASSVYYHPTAASDSEDQHHRDSDVTPRPTRLYALGHAGEPLVTPSRLVLDRSATMPMTTTAVTTPPPGLMPSMLGAPLGSSPTSTVTGLVRPRRISGGSMQLPTPSTRIARPSKGGNTVPPRMAMSMVLPPRPVPSHSSGLEPLSSLGAVVPPATPHYTPSMVTAKEAVSDYLARAALVAKESRDRSRVLSPEALRDECLDLRLKLLHYESSIPNHHLDLINQNIVLTKRVLDLQLRLDTAKTIADPQTPSSAAHGPTKASVRDALPRTSLYSAWPPHHGDDDAAAAEKTIAPVMDPQPLGPVPLKSANSPSTPPHVRTATTFSTPTSDSPSPAWDDSEPVAAPQWFPPSTPFSTTAAAAPAAATPVDGDSPLDVDDTAATGTEASPDTPTPATVPVARGGLQKRLVTKESRRDLAAAFTGSTAAPTTRRKTRGRRTSSGSSTSSSYSSSSHTSSNKSGSSSNSDNEGRANGISDAELMGGNNAPHPPRHIFRGADKELTLSASTSTSDTEGSSMLALDAAMTRGLSESLMCVRMPVASQPLPESPQLVRTPAYLSRNNKDGAMATPEPPSRRTLFPPLPAATTPLSQSVLRRSVSTPVLSATPTLPPTPQQQQRSDHADSVSVAIQSAADRVLALSNGERVAPLSLAANGGVVTRTPRAPRPSQQHHSGANPPPLLTLSTPGSPTTAGSMVSPTDGAAQSPTRLHEGGLSVQTPQSPDDSILFDAIDPDATMLDHLGLADDEDRVIKVSGSGSLLFGGGGATASARRRSGSVSMFSLHGSNEPTPRQQMIARVPSSPVGTPRAGSSPRPPMSPLLGPGSHIPAAATPAAAGGELDVLVECESESDDVHSHKGDGDDTHGPAGELVGSGAAVADQSWVVLTDDGPFGDRSSSNSGSAAANGRHVWGGSGEIPKYVDSLGVLEEDEDALPAALDN